MYDESILVAEEDGDDDEYELLAGRKRAGVSPVRRAPFSQQQYRPPPQRSFLQHSRDFQRSEDDDDDSLGSMSGEDEGSPVPLNAEQHVKKSSKDFVPQPPQHEKAGGSGKQHENLVSLASNFAKKMMSSGSDKTKEKLPPDVAEARRDSKGATNQQTPQNMRKLPQDQQPSSSKAQPAQHPKQKPPQQQNSKSADEEDDDDDDEDYDDVNMAQIEGLLNRVERSGPMSGGRYIPRPPPSTPPQYFTDRHNPSAIGMDRGAAGEPYGAYSSRMFAASSDYSPRMEMPTQFHPGCGPAASNLMAYTRGSIHGGASSEDDSSPEVSISEGDAEFSKMEELMKTYRGDMATSDPRDMGVSSSSDLGSMAMVDEEVLQNIMAQRRLWEIDIDMKREALRKRTLVMSPFLGVHAPNYEMYNPLEYEQLNVSPEIKELFHYISRYEAPIIGSQMDLKLKPFIPEYYPSVGDIDAFLKVTHPEVQDDTLGIKCLDEPSPFQSDPSVLDLRLRALAKQSSSKSVVVKKIENVGKNTKVIENWIKDISDLHRSKPSPSVHYSKPMPDIDSLIQEWPPQLEDLLKNISLPSSELDCDLSTYVDIVCNLLDIPVYKSRIQSLHVLFTLYATYKHFNQYGPLGMSSTGGGGSGGGNESVRLDDGDVDRLQIN